MKVKYSPGDFTVVCEVDITNEVGRPKHDPESKKIGILEVGDEIVITRTITTKDRIRGQN
eukprot:UN04230